MNNKIHNIYNMRQLFIDKKFIDKSSNITIKVNKPIKTGELNLVREGSAHNRIGGYNSIIYDEGIYKLYYGETLYQKEGVYAYICYATSTDGINFVKPNLNLATQFKNNNNIILGFGAGGVEKGLGDGGCMVFIDPNDKKNKYKMVARHGLKRHLGLYVSNDGMHFKYDKEKILDDGRFEKAEGEIIKGFHLDSQNIIFFDERIKKYVTYVRKNFELAGQHRTIARGESDDLEHFPLVDDMDVIMQADNNDEMIFNKEFNVNTQAIDFYTNATIKYKDAQDVYVMFPSVYYKYGKHIKQFKNNKPMNAGPIDIRFAASRDGILWDRYDRESYVELGNKSDFDAYSLYMVHGIVPGKGNDMYMYYSGSDIIHGYNRGDQYEKRENAILEKAHVQANNNITAISRLKLRKDGFVSVKGAYKGGFLQTPLITFKGKKLLLNVNTSACGTIKVALLDEYNQPIKGFSLQDCDLIHTTNDINKVVTWNKNDDVAKLEGGKIKIYFEIRDSELFAFQFTN